MKVKEYKDFLFECKHEVFTLQYIEQQALANGFEPFGSNNDKLIFKFNKLIALVERGANLAEDGANIIISHIDSPRLDVIPGNPFVEKEDGVFWKTSPYGGIINQSWTDKPLVLVGEAYNKDGKVLINTELDKVYFTVSSLLPHLSGRKEMDALKSEKLMVRMGHNVMKKLQKKYNLTKEDLQMADLSFVPAGKPLDIGFDKELIAGYGHDDRSCAFAELKAFFNSEHNTKTKIAIFASYEETGSGQGSGAESLFIDDIFLELTGSQIKARQAMRNSKMISADVQAGYDSNYNTHFEENTKVIAGKGVGVVPFLGQKRGNDSTAKIRNFIKTLCIENDIPYQIESTKVSEGGGGTVSTFFGFKCIDVIDIGIPVLAMHSPQELISKKDLESAYKLYKLFFES